MGALEADGFIHRYMREHMTEIEDSMEPDMKAETLKHTPQEIEDALSNSYEHFIEENRAKFAEEIKKHSEADESLAATSLVELQDSDQSTSPEVAKKGFSLTGMTVLFAVARSRSQRASVDPASQGFERAASGNMHSELQSPKSRSLIDACRCPDAGPHIC